MGALPNERYTFRVTVPVPGVPQYPHRFDMWADHAPLPPMMAAPDYPRWLREEYLARRRVKAQAARVQEAGHPYAVDLDAPRCRFGPRTMTLAGTIESAHVEAAVDTVLATVRWTLWMVYADNQAEYPGGPNKKLTATGLSLRPARSGRPARPEAAHRGAAE